MKFQYSLKMTSPCSEKWDEMQPNEDGRFCLHCQKTVIDFSQMNDNEIAFYLHLNRGKDICASMRKHQDNKNYAFIQAQRSESPVKIYVMAIMAGLMVALPTTANGQNVTPIQIEQSVSANPKKLPKTDSLTKNSLSLRLLDNSNGSPLRYLKVTLKLDNEELATLNGQIKTIKEILYLYEECENFKKKQEESDKADTIFWGNMITAYKEYVGYLYKRNFNKDVSENAKAELETKLQEAREVKKGLKERLKVPTDYTVLGKTDENGYIFIPLSDDMPVSRVSLSFELADMKVKDAKGESNEYASKRIDNITLQYKGGQQKGEEKIFIVKEEYIQMNGGISSGPYIPEMDSE